MPTLFCPTHTKYAPLNLILMMFHSNYRQFLDHLGRLLKCRIMRKCLYHSKHLELVNPIRALGWTATVGAMAIKINAKKQNDEEKQKSEEEKQATKDSSTLMDIDQKMLPKQKTTQKKKRQLSTMRGLLHGCQWRFTRFFFLRYNFVQKENIFHMC